MKPSSGKKVVIKVGTGVLTRGDRGELHHAMIARLVQAIADLTRAGHQCFLVSSGAVGAGLDAFGLDSRPTEVELLQGCAAVGQASLISIYETSFAHYQLQVAQLLLTHQDLNDAHARTNVTNTLNTLLKFPNIIPIINENDSVATYELKVGDNDTLSSELAQLIGADLLVLLTTVPGLRSPEAKGDFDIITEVDDVDDVMSFASDEKGKLSMGGMASKLQAVKSAVDAGIETIIASGTHPEQLPDLVDGHGVGTRFTI
ncbi:MAG: glutamate 5-kinase [Verrucomicrobiota bacterium]